MATKQMIKKKRGAKTKAKTLVGLYDGKNLLLNESLGLPFDARVLIKVDRKRDGKNGRKQISAMVQPSIEPDAMAGTEASHTEYFAPHKKTSAKEIERAVRRMARMHFEAEECIDRIIWFKGTRNEDKIHLIEVNRGTFPTGSVMAFYFPESEKFLLPVRLADVTPEEWDKICAGKIPLPQGWSLKNAIEYEREETLAEGR